MARKLPWSTSTAASTPARRKPASKPLGESSIVPSSDDEGTPKPQRLAQSNLKIEVTPKKSRRSRSPSTSPVHGPPSAAPMRPGYGADDVYKMVEDELQAVAQTFTHHLHAAEYKRLKRKAREAPPRTTGMLPRLSPSAPKEVKCKLEVMALQDRQQKAVAGDMEEGEKARDPWLGTSLAGLMGSTSQPKRTLMGSQEIQSSTRAASGFPRGEGDSPSKHTKVDKLDLLITHSEHPKQKEILPARRSISPSPTKLARTHESEKLASSTTSSRVGSKPSPSPAAPTTTTANLLASRLKVSARPPRKKFAFDDDFDINALNCEVAHDEPVKLSAVKRKIKPDVKGERETKKTKLSDIPMFLV